MAHEPPMQSDAPQFYGLTLKTPTPVFMHILALSGLPRPPCKAWRDAWATIGHDAPLRDIWLLAHPRPAWALGSAVRAGLDGTVRCMLARGGLEQAPLGRLLCQAAKRGYVEVARLLLGHEADLKFGDSLYPGGALGAAVEHGHLEMMQLLLDHKAEIREWTIHAAVSGGSTELVDLLLAHGADKGQALAMYARLGDLDEARKLLADPDTDIDAHECQPLVSAAEGGHLDMVRLLLEHGADPDWAVIDVHAAGQVEALELMYQYGARRYEDTYVNPQG